MKMGKLKKLIQELPKNAVILDKWLKERDISNSLKQKYLQYGWLKSIGRGASHLSNNTPSWQNAVVAMQENDDKLHIGGKTALALQGVEHFISEQLDHLYLYGQPKQKLPVWFLQYDWQLQIHYFQTQFLPSNIGIDNLNHTAISSPERSILELLYLIPKEQGIEKAYYIIENLNNLNHTLLQILLESCSSIKVNRLFFCLSERANHGWLNLLNKEKINFGSGNRMIVANGYLDPSYNITLPKHWKDNETPLF